MRLMERFEHSSGDETWVGVRYEIARDTAVSAPPGDDRASAAP
jgi:hypothetical protein